MQSREVTDAVYQLARVGLSEVAKNLQNGPAAIAQAASLLEAWRSSCDAQIAAADKLAADAKGKV